ncbi:MAG: type III-A CRISPR-associated RAMP protein Csm3 [Hungatella sp.]|nr:type III-A CRISPR-associated RAMP protein Csm3 [Hungatella sp.]
MKLKEIVKFSGKIYCVSGLSIGGSSNTLDIGGVDREVIKNPVTKEPYIPGSSLKGKMRSELEKKYGSLKWIDDKKNGQLKVRVKDKKYGKILVPSEKEPCGCGRNTCPICLIFGAYKNSGADSAPTRIIVRDAILSRNMIEDGPLILERKTENIILRDSGTAGSPRTIERVPEGTSFKFEIVLRIFEGDDKNDLVSKVEEGLELVGKSYLGGGGSRGSGYVKFDYEITYDCIQPKPNNSV